MAPGGDGPNSSLHLEPFHISDATGDEVTARHDWAVAHATAFSAVGDQPWALGTDMVCQDVPSQLAAMAWNVSTPEA